MGSERNHVGSNFALEVDGISAGVVNSASGGLVQADVISENMGVTAYVPKHIGQLTYPDISFKCGAAMSKGYYDWIKTSFDANYQRKNGALIHCDFNYKEVARLTFFNALMTKIGFPALKADSKEPAAMDIGFAIEKSTFTTAPAGSISGKYPTFNDKQKRWTCANFRLKIDGLDDVCKATTAIDAITLTQATAVNAVGEMREIQKEPAAVSYSDLVITFNANKMDGAVAWWKTFVQDGVCDESQEKTGTLEFLTTDLKKTMFTVTFEHLGVYKLELDPANVGGDDLQRMKMTMYCEHMKFDLNSEFVGA
jgi:phage tail-like protein